MKTLLLLVIPIVCVFVSSCINSDISYKNNDTLLASFSGTTELFTGLENLKTIESLTPECIDGLNYLNIDTLILKNDTLKWSCYDNDLESIVYFVYKIKNSNDSIYAEYIGFEHKGIMDYNKLQDNIIFIKDKKGFSISLYYLKYSYHLQFISFIPLDLLKNDYINMLEKETDSLKYWNVKIQFSKK